MREDDDRARRDRRGEYATRREERYREPASYRPPPRGVSGTWGRWTQEEEEDGEPPQYHRRPERRRRSRSRERRRRRSPSPEARSRRRRRREEEEGEAKRSSEKRRERSLSWSPPPAVRRQMAEAKARREREAKEGPVKTGKFWDGFRWVEHTPASQLPSNPATRKERRLYVGNLPQTFDSDQLRVFLNEALRACGAIPEGLDEVVVSSWVSPDKKFAFVELSTVEAASTALGLSGITCMGTNLKICHPNNYQMTGFPNLIPDPANAAALVAQNPELVAAALAAINAVPQQPPPQDAGFSSAAL